VPDGLYSTTYPSMLPPTSVLCTATHTSPLELMARPPGRYSGAVLAANTAASVPDGEKLQISGDEAVAEG
jgi:hypothetical protein